MAAETPSPPDSSASRACTHLRNAIHLRSPSRSLAVHRRRRGCGNACPIYGTPRRCQGACSFASPRTQACDDEDSLRKELRKELRMVPLWATEGAADMPSPSCGVVLYLCMWLCIYLCRYYEIIYVFAVEV